jgi:cation diffusion facilitator CzcD-associated flavoprotein CzcO
MSHNDVWDVVVVGGGQAGLSVGYHLARQGLRFVILEAGGAGAPARDGVTLNLPCGKPRTSRRPSAPSG